MKPEKIYQELIMLAEKLGIAVSEQNFRQTGVKAQSGLCKVKGQMRLILDKHKSFHDKNEILIESFSKMPHENVYVIPAVRELLNKYNKKVSG